MTCHSFGQKSSAGPQLSETSPGNECDDLPFHGDICGPVAATLNEDMFNIVLSRWREAYEDLKHSKDYKTLSAAGSLMKNMVSKYVCHTFKKDRETILRSSCITSYVFLSHFSSEPMSLRTVCIPLC